MRLQAVLFDLDDTLLVDDPATWATFDCVADAAAERAGVNAAQFCVTAKDIAESLWEASDVAAYCDRVGISSFECLWGRFDESVSDPVGLRTWSRDFQARVWREALQRCGIDDKALAGELDACFQRERRARLVLMDHALEALEALRKAFRLGLLTNGAVSLQQEKIDALDLAPAFDAVLISGEIGIGKPSVEVFEEIARRLDVDRRCCVMIGNSLDRDIAGARNAGIRSIWMHVPGCGDRGQATPDATIRDLSELPEALDRIA